MWSKLIISINQIRFKLFILNTLLPVAAIFMLGYIAYNYSVNLLINNEFDRISSLSKRADDQLNQYILETRQLLGNLSIELETTNFDPEKIQALLSQYQNNKPQMFKNIYYISASGQLFQSIDSVQPSENYMKLYYETMYSKRDLHSIGPVFMGKDGFVVLFSIKVRKGTSIQGIAAASLNMTFFNDAIQKIDYDNRFSMLLFNEHLEPVLSDTKILYAPFLKLLPQLKQWAAKPDGSIEVEEGKNQYLITGRSVGFNDWFLVYFVDKKIFLAEVRKFTQYTVYFALIFSFIMVLFSINMSRFINKPIYMLIRDIEGIKAGNLKTRIRLKRKDEFQTLANSFNAMLDRIEVLMEENSQIEVAKKQFELRALQAQINPHFLYNTLNCINSLLDLERREQIPVVIRSLVQLFQYTMDKKEEWVDIGTELKGLHHYIELQQIRYRNKFRVEINLTSKLSVYGILKLTLQPILENCIFHGIKGKQGVGLITIGGTLDEQSGSLLLYVEDNGCGIPQERLTRLLEKSDISFERTGLEGFNSIGLRNVHERLQLHFGNEHGLQVSSEVGRGTRVNIRYPAIKHITCPKEDAV